MNVGTERREVPHQPVGACGDCVQQGGRQKAENLAAAADEIAAISADDFKAVPSKDLLEVGDDGLAHVAAINRVAMLIPLVEGGKIGATEDHMNPLTKIDGVG